MKKGSQETDNYVQEMKQGTNNILVAVRVRPLNSKEQSIIELETVRVLDSKMVVLLDPENEFSNDVLKKNRTKDLTFAFDVVFDRSVEQRQVYENTTQFLIEGVMDGFNATVFAYGATGAGKTYTMTGSGEKTGIIPRTLNDLFVWKNKQQRAIKVKVSYLEIYNEMIRDLLTAEDRNLDLREDGKQGQVIAGISEVEVSSTSEILTLLKIGNRNRAKEPTLANEHSTRSHAILQLQVESTDKNQIQLSKLSLVDLAGSERAAATSNRGQRMVEGAKINQSLLVLGNCIQALCSQTEKNKALFIPYRGSKLTRLLKDSLGGNCRTVMIANVSPSVISFEDTYNTLNYANRAKNIKTQVNRNVMNVNDHIANYAQIIEQLRLENEDLKKQLVGNNPPSIPANQPKVKLLPSIGAPEPINRESVTYKEFESQVVKQYQEEKEIMQKMFETEDKLDQIMVEVLKMENSKTKDNFERTKLDEKLEFERNRMQVLEIDLNDLSVKFQDCMARRKAIRAKIQKQDLGHTNGLILLNLIRQNALTIENLQFRQNEKRGDIQTKLKELEIEYLQKQLQQKDYGNPDPKSKAVKHIFSQDRMAKQALLPQIRKGQRSPSQIEIKRKRFDYRDLQIDFGTKPINNSYGSLSPTGSGKENDTQHDFSLQERTKVPSPRPIKFNKQRSLVLLPDMKQKLSKHEVAVQNSPRDKAQPELNEEEIKRLRLKRLNLRLKQNKIDQPQR